MVHLVPLLNIGIGNKKVWETCCEIWIESQEEANLSMAQAI